MYPDRWFFDNEKYQMQIHKHKFDLITSDCELKIPSNMFNEQEVHNSVINFNQIVIVLNILPIGKNYVFKSFIPFAEPLTISLLFLLTCVFEEIKIVKPVTSQQSSSEVYVICKNHYGYDQYPEILKNRLNFFQQNFDAKKSIFPNELIGDKFLNELTKCSEFFVNRQISSICINLWYRYKFYEDYDIQEKISEIRSKMIKKWIQEYNMKILDDKKHLLAN